MREKGRNSVVFSKINNINNSKEQISELFQSALKNSKNNSKKGIINLKKVSFEDEKPIFLESVLKKKTIQNQNQIKNKKTKEKNSKTVIKKKMDIPVLDLNILGDENSFECMKNMAIVQKQSKTKLDANFDKTDFYLLSLRHILEKEKIYNSINKKITRKKTYSVSVFDDENINQKSKKQNEKYMSQFKPHQEYKRINIIICDDEVDVARAAEEIVKKYFRNQGNNPHVYYTKNGIECLYLIYKLSIIEKQIIKFILMDVEMDILDGITTCNIIKDNRALTQKVFLLSGDPRDCKADGYCSKPLTEADLKKITNI